MEILKFKVAAYEKCKLKIKTLQEELRQEQETLATLEKYISSQDPAFLSSTFSNHIQRIPTEVLSIIFTHFLRDQPTHIRRLLLVCCRWFNIIMNSPSLWTHIKISLNTTYDKNQFLSRTTYVRTCIERSQQLLLDIVVDYGWCMGTEEYFSPIIQDKVSSLFSGVPVDAMVCPRVLDNNYESGSDNSEDGTESDDPDISMLRGYELEGWLASFRWDRCPIQRQLERYYLLPLEHLVGSGGEVMKRWKSINITFPSSLEFKRPNGLATKTMDLFVFPAPFLESIQLKGLYERGESSSASDSGPFPVTTSLTTLHLFNHTIQVVSPLINHSQLVDLHVKVINFEQLLTLSLSKCLRRLSLLLPPLFIHVQFDIPEDFFLEFPNLRELICKGFIPINLSGRIRAPHLELLRLECYDAFKSIHLCSFVPSVKRLQIPGGLSRLVDMGPEEFAKVPAIIQKYTSLRELCVHPSEARRMEEDLIQLRSLGHLPFFETLEVEEIPNTWIFS